MANAVRVIAALSVVLPLMAVITHPLAAQQDDATAQAARDLEREAERAASDRRVAPISARTRDQGGPSTRTAPALLREGSYLTDIVGLLRPDPQTGTWVFILERSTDETGSTGAPPQFIFLPSTPLEQMQRTVESTDLEVLFRMNARVYAFQDRNYILPIGAAQLDRYSESPTEPRANQPDTAGDEAQGTRGNQSATDILQSLREEVTLPRALEGVPEDSDQASATTGGGRATIEENSLVVNRRGRLSRNATGAFVFVFDADATGLADPPMTLLPCLLLERLQREYHRGGSGATLLISGSVFTYRGRNFLLPTVYRLERTSGNLRR